MLSQLGSSSHQVLAIGIMFTLGLGLGFSASSFLLAVQNSVPWSTRGVATSSVAFFRTMGGAIGVAILGSVFNGRMASELMRKVATGSLALGQLSAANALFQPSTRASIPVAALGAMVDALAHSLRVVFLVLIGFALVGVVVATLLPGGRAEEHAWEAREVGSSVVEE